MLKLVHFSHADLLRYVVRQLEHFFPDDGNADGPAQTGHKPIQVDFAADPGGLEEDAPVPVVIHAGCPLCEGTICCASALLR